MSDKFVIHNARPFRGRTLVAQALNHQIEGGALATNKKDVGEIHYLAK